jgi:hypothetical protein
VCVLHCVGSTFTSKQLPVLIAPAKRLTERYGIIRQQVVYGIKSLLALSQFVTSERISASAVSSSIVVKYWLILDMGTERLKGISRRSKKE